MLDLVLALGGVYKLAAASEADLVEAEAARCRWGPPRAAEEDAVPDARLDAVTSTLAVAGLSSTAA